MVTAADGLPVWFDSGVRSGGPDQSFGARRNRRGCRSPYVYGLALEGKDGIIHVLRSLLAEAELIIAVDAYPSLDALRVAGALHRN